MKTRIYATPAVKGLSVHLRCTMYYLSDVYTLPAHNMCLISLFIAFCRCMNKPSCEVQMANFEICGDEADMLLTLEFYCVERKYWPASARYCLNAGLMLCRRRTRWPNIKPTLGQRLM